MMPFEVVIAAKKNLRYSFYFLMNEIIVINLNFSVTKT